MQLFFGEGKGAFPSASRWLKSRQRYYFLYLVEGLTPLGIRENAEKCFSFSFTYTMRDVQH
jgi:hypothetical protein